MRIYIIKMFRPRKNDWRIIGFMQNMESALRHVEVFECKYRKVFKIIHNRKVVYQTDCDRYFIHNWVKEGF